MLNLLNKTLLIFSLFIITSCGVQQSWIKKEVLSVNIPNKELEHSIYLLGDGGKPLTKHIEPAHQILSNHLTDNKLNAKQKTVLFLGDNIYQYGLPSNEDQSYPEAERRLKTQLQTVKDHEGIKIMIPGNHDWNMSKKGGLAQVKNEQLYVENYLGDSTFLPKNGCPGPISISLNENLLLLVIDSEWWLHKHEKPAGENSPCNSKNKDQFLANLQQTITDNEDKTIIIAMHHPLYTNGGHGGYFPVKDHIFPLLMVKKWLYVPLPVIGSIYPVGRMLGASRQDLSNKHYKSLKREILANVKHHNNIVFVAGHEHSLQLSKKNNVYQIVSGTACKTSPLRKGKDALFVSKEEGLARIDQYRDGSIYVTFSTIDEVNKEVELFSYQLKK